MPITIKSLPRMQQAEAEAATENQNDIFENEGIENIYVAKTGQLNLFFSTILPAERSAEFEEASLEDKSKFYLVGTLAQLDTTKTFLEAWQENYDIIFD
jgi:hypothetical protein